MTYHVYLTDWIAVFTSDEDGNLGTAQCLDHYQQKYEGCVRDDEHRVEPSGDGWPSTLMLRVPVLLGEFRYLPDAEKCRGRACAEYGVLIGAVSIVEAGSEEDETLKNYGKRKLPT